jgi:hypothetical protein
MTGLKKPDRWSKEPTLERYRQKNGKNSQIGSLGVKSREIRNKLGLK